MPAQHWTRVTADTFRGFHNMWLTRIADALNGGLMPDDYYVMQEPDAGPYVPDLLALREGGAATDAAAGGGTAVLLAPPKVAHRREYRGAARERVLRRYLAVRRNDGDGLVALIEIVSASNKDVE